mgnify:CR=1 FL=1
MRHVFHPEAAAEFEEAVRFYRERGRGLGQRFAAEVRVAIRKVLERAGLTVADIDLIEINEAFAVVALACARELEIPHQRIGNFY